MSDLGYNANVFWSLIDGRIRSALRRVARPVRGVLGVINPAAPALGAQLEGRAGETVSDVEVAQHYGLATAPPGGTDVVAVPIGGSGEHLIIVGEIDHAHRPQSLSDGEVALYSTAGAMVHLREDGSIRISTTGGATVELNGAEVRLNGPGPAVARVGDNVSQSAAFVAWAAALTAATGVPALTGAVGAISTGSSTVQAGG